MITSQRLSMHDEGVQVREVLRKAEGVDSSLSAQPRALTPTPSLFADSLFLGHSYSKSRIAFLGCRIKRLLSDPADMATYGKGGANDSRPLLRSAYGRQVPEWIVRTGVLPLPERAAPPWRRPWAQAHKRQRPRLTGNNNDSNRLVHGGRSA